MMHLIKLFTWVLAVGVSLGLAGSGWAQQETMVVDENNEFGGRTVEIMNKDNSYVHIFYDDDETKVKEETVFTSEYPIDNGLRKVISHFAFDKKVKEERIFTSKVAQNTLITRTIDHYDRFTGEKTRSENHFVESLAGYNVVYREGEKIQRIEWHYPQNNTGIVKNIVYYDGKERGVMVESFYSEQTVAKKGYDRRVYYNEYSPDKYFRKTKQEWYYTDEYARQHKGIVKKVEHFHYSADGSTRVETILLDKDNQPVAWAER